MYDILIPSHSKDFTKLKYVFDSIQKNLEGFNNVFIISNVPVPKNLKFSSIQYFLDSDVIDFDFSKFKGVIKDRTSWYRQEFVKLFQQVTSDEYLVSEADSIYLNSVNIIEDEKPVFLFGKDQNHFPYYAITQKLFGFGREYPYSFINEVMYIKRQYVNELVKLTPFNKYGFFELITNELNKTQETSGLSDYDLYGNFVAKYHKDDYKYKHIQTVATALHSEWTEEEIRKNIIKYKGTDFIMTKLHSWI